MGIGRSRNWEQEEPNQFFYNFPDQQLTRRRPTRIRRNRPVYGGFLSAWNWRRAAFWAMASEETMNNRPAFDSDHEDRDDESIATLLSSLIRRSQVRLLTAETGYYEMDEDTNLCSAQSDEERLHNSVYKSGDPKTYAEILHKNDIKMLVTLNSGEFSMCKQSAAQRNSILKRIRGREYGGLAKPTVGHLNDGDRCYINKSLLPNAMSKIDTYRSKAFCAQYTKDGNVLITACQDHRIRFYDLTKGPAGSKLKSSSSYHQFNVVEAKDVGWSVLDVAVSPDGRHVVYSSWSDYIYQCNIYGDHDSNHLGFHLNPGEYRFCVFSLRFSSDGVEILAGASDRCLYVYDRERNARTLKIEAHEDDVNAVCFADSTSQIIYSGGDDGLCKVWDRRTLSEERPKPVGILAGHTDGITFIDSKGDARYLISNSKDQSIKLWDIRRFSNDDGMRETRLAVAKQTWDYRWQNVPRKVLSYQPLSGDTSVMTYRDTHTVLHTLIRCFFSPEFSTGQRYIYTGCASGACVIYDVLTGAPVKRLKEHHACVRDVSWHPYNNEICTSSWDGVVARWYHDGRADVDSEGCSWFSLSDSSDMDDNDSESQADMDGLEPSARTRLRLYRRRQAPLRRSERIREQQRRRGLDC